MKSIFNNADNQEFISRINQLTVDTKPQWGKMSVDQMLEHCLRAAKSSTGELKPRRGLMGIIFGKMAKKSVVNEKPFKQGLPTDPSFRVVDHANFEEGRKKLIEIIARLGNEGTKALTTGPHPFFGTMSPKEWDMLMSKHIDHHLRQFGV